MHLHLLGRKSIAIALTSCSVVSKCFVFGRMTHWNPQTCVVSTKKALYQSSINDHSPQSHRKYRDRLCTVAHAQNTALSTQNRSRERGYIREKRRRHTTRLHNGPAGVAEFTDTSSDTRRRRQQQRRHRRHHRRRRPALVVSEMMRGDTKLLPLASHRRRTESSGTYYIQNIINTSASPSHTDRHTHTHKTLLTPS